MTIHINTELGTTFELPDKLTPRLDSAYQAQVNEGIKYAESQGLTVVGALAYCIVVGSALQSHLITRWESIVMPQFPENEDDVSLPIVYWAGPIIVDWIGEQRKIPKASFWARLKLAYMGLSRDLHRSN